MIGSLLRGLGKEIFSFHISYVFWVFHILCFLFLSFMTLLFDKVLTLFCILDWDSIVSFVDHSRVISLVWTICILILPVDRDARTLPRQTWIDFCAVLASVLHRDSPQEPAKDRTTPLRPITLRRPSQRLNHQILRENSRTLRNRAKTLSQRTQALASVKK